MLNQLNKNEEQCLIWSCMEGLTKYAKELQDKETNQQVKAVPELIERMKSYWSLEDAPEKERRPKQRDEKKNVILGLYYHINDILFVQGAEAREEIEKAKDVMTGVADRWKLDEFQVLVLQELIDIRVQFAEKE